MGLQKYIEHSSEPLFAHSSIFTLRFRSNLVVVNEELLHNLIRFLEGSRLAVNLALPGSSFCIAPSPVPRSPSTLTSTTKRGLPGLRIKFWKKIMIFKPQIPQFQIPLPSPDHSSPPSLIFSDGEADDEGAMSSDENIPSSRPISLGLGGFHPVGPYCPRVPTLQEILSNSAPPPWTLSAFTAHLSQNHCLENLEFVKDAERYRKEYDLFRTQYNDVSRSPHFQKRDEVKRLWQKIIKAYIVPNAPREVNLPSDVRHALLELPNQSSPPSPDALDPAVRRVYDLMNESSLMSFVSELSPTRSAPSIHDDSEPEERLRARMSPGTTRARSHSRRKTSQGTDVSSAQFGEVLHHAQTLGGPQIGTHHSPSTEMMLTDDSGSLPSPTDSPMTPPTTPPSGEPGGTSPRMKGDNIWKKMAGRLGNKKKSNSQFPPTSE